MGSKGCGFGGKLADPVKEADSHRRGGSFVVLSPG